MTAFLQFLAIYSCFFLWQVNNLAIHVTEYLATGRILLNTLASQTLDVWKGQTVEDGARGDVDWFLH